MFVLWVLNSIFNNIEIKSWYPVLLVEGTKSSGENHQHSATKEKKEKNTSKEEKQKAEKSMEIKSCFRKVTKMCLGSQSMITFEYLSIMLHSVSLR